MGMKWLIMWVSGIVGSETLRQLVDEYPDSMDRHYIPS